MPKIRKKIHSSEIKFAALLVLLLAIMGIAPVSILEYILASQAEGHPIDSYALVLTILLLTGGFLFMAGGLGVWAFRSSMTAELQRTIGRLIDSLDYLPGGLICTDSEGKVLAANPAAHSMALSSERSHPALRDLFPELSQQDVDVLLNQRGGREIERKANRNGSALALRFRSQNQKGLHFILVSDVTQETIHQQEFRRQAQLQLIGRIARGVAHDFNNILCAVSGHASLLSRQGMKSEDESSIQTILEQTNRGAALARRLMDLARENPKSELFVSLPDILHQAEDLIKVALDAGIQLQYDLEPVQARVTLDPAQIEQIVVNLCVLTADQMTPPGILHIQSNAILSGPAGTGPAVLVSMYSQPDIESCSAEKIPSTFQEMDHMGGDGVILSVIASQVEEVGGSLVRLKLEQQDRGFRVILPCEEVGVSSVNDEDPPPAWRLEFMNWSVLLGLHGNERKNEAVQFSKTEPLHLFICDELSTVLTQLERDNAFKLIILDKRLFATEGDSVLRVISRLHPQTPVILLGENSGESPIPSEDNPLYEVPSHLSFPDLFSSVRKLLHDSKGG